MSREGETCPHGRVIYIQREDKFKDRSKRLRGDQRKSFNFIQGWVVIWNALAGNLVKKVNLTTFK